MDPRIIPANPQPTSSEKLHLEATPDGDSVYSREDYDLCQAPLQYINHTLLDGDLEETAAPVNRLDSLPVPAEDFATNPGPPTTIQSHGENCPYNSGTFDFSKTVSKYLHDMMMETEVGVAPVDELITPTAKYINVTDGVPVIGFDPHPPHFLNDPEPHSTNPSSSSATLVTMRDKTSHENEPSDIPYAALNYIQDMLLEEDFEDSPCMLQNSLALQAAEKSFYDILVEKDPLSSDRFTGSASENWAPRCSSTDDLAKSHSLSDQQIHERTSLEQFRLLNSADKRSIDGQELVSQHTADQSKDRKNRQREDDIDGYFEEGRSNKHSLASTEESKQLEILCDMFVQNVENKEPILCPTFDMQRNEASKKFQQEQKFLASHTRAKRLTSDGEKVDLLTLLNQCAEAAGRGNQGGATEILNQIREHSSPYGDASQRLAHYFANGIEARLVGNTNMSQARLPGHSATIIDILNAYKLYASICPFRRITNLWTNRMMAIEAENKTRIHVIDFGIAYGFQWPCLIHLLSTRPGGPPRIKITGIEFPQPGFRPVCTD